MIGEWFKIALEELEDNKKTVLTASIQRNVNRRRLVITSQIAVCLWCCMLEDLFPILSMPFDDKVVDFIECKVIADGGSNAKMLMQEKQNVKLSWRRTPHDPAKQVNIPIDCFYDLSSILREANHLNDFSKANPIRLPNYRARNNARTNVPRDEKIAFTCDALLKYAINCIPSCGTRLKRMATALEMTKKEAYDALRLKWTLHLTRQNSSVHDIQNMSDKTQGTPSNKTTPLQDWLLSGDDPILKKHRTGDGIVITEFSKVPAAMSISTTIPTSHQPINNVPTTSLFVKDSQTEVTTFPEARSPAYSMSALSADIACDLNSTFSNKGYDDDVATVVTPVDGSNTLPSSNQAIESPCASQTTVDSTTASTTAATIKTTTTEIKTEWIDNEVAASPSSEAKWFSLIKQLLLNGIIGFDFTEDLKVNIKFSADAIASLLKSMLEAIHTGTTDRSVYVEMVKNSLNFEGIKVKYLRKYNFSLTNIQNAVRDNFDGSIAMQLVDTMNALACIPPVFGVLPDQIEQIKSPKKKSSSDCQDYRSLYPLFGVHPVVAYNNIRHKETKEAVLFEYKRIYEFLEQLGPAMEIEEPGLNWGAVVGVVAAILGSIAPDEYSQVHPSDGDFLSYYALYCPMKRFPVVWYDLDDDHPGFMMLNKTNFDAELKCQLHSKAYVHDVLAYGRGNAFLFDKDVGSCPLLMMCQKDEES
jgi:hypothetical protein